MCVFLFGRLGCRLVDWVSSLWSEAPPHSPKSTKFNNHSTHREGEVHVGAPVPQAPEALHAVQDELCVCGFVVKVLMPMYGYVCRSRPTHPHTQTHTQSHLHPLVVHPQQGMVIEHHAPRKVRGLEHGEGDEALVDVLQGHREPPRRERGHRHGRALVLPLGGLCVWGWLVKTGRPPDRGGHKATINARNERT